MLMLNTIRRQLSLAGRGARGSAGPKGDPGAGGNVVTTALALYNQDASEGDGWYLTGDYDRGNFVMRHGDRPADPLQGIYKVSSKAGFYWERDWDGIHGRPEWFFLESDQTTGDWLAALKAGVVLCPVLLLRAFGYGVSDTWKINTPYREVRCTAHNSSADGQGTRIILRGSTGTAVQVGPDTVPTDANGNPNINGFLTGVRVGRMTITRDQFPARPASDDVGVAPTGLRLQYLWDCDIGHISTREHLVGAYYAGCVNTRVASVEGFRTHVGNEPANDYFYGHYLNGYVNIGTAGGNASLSLIECKARIGRAAAGNFGTEVGYGLDGASVDTFISKPEATDVLDAMVISGTAGSTNPNLKKYGDADIHVVSPVFDQVRRGIVTQKLSAYGAIDIFDPYIGLKAGAAAGIQHSGSTGAVTVVGGQIIGTVDADAGGTAIGVLDQSSTGLDLVGLKLVGLHQPIQASDSSLFEYGVTILNPEQQTVNAALSLTRCSLGKVRPKMTGGAGLIAQGIATASCDRMWIDASQIDPTCLKTGVGNKVVIDGVQALTEGYYVKPDGTQTMTHLEGLG